MNPRDFLDQASELATGPREVDWRTAASRAYYAAFHVGSELLRAAGFAAPTDQSSHAYVWMRLSNAKLPQVETVGRALSILRQVRGHADYDLARPFTEQQGVKQVNDALTVVELLDDLAATPAVLAEVVAAIRDYERDVLRQVTWRGP